MTKKRTYFSSSMNVAKMYKYFFILSFLYDTLSVSANLRTRKYLHAREYSHNYSMQELHSLRGDTERSFLIHTYKPISVV